jgi:hypothetical protein
VRGEIRQTRYPKHHRLFFAILKFVQMHCPRFEHRSIEAIKLAIKLATNLVTLQIDEETGRLVYLVKSISFDAMDQIRFNRFFDDACIVIAQRWMPEGTAPEDVRAELLKMMEGPYQLRNLPTTPAREPRREAWLREPLATVGVTRESKGYRSEDPCSQGSCDPTLSEPVA